MKLITRDTDYAARALIFIASQEKEIVSVTELVDELKIPRPFLRKILQTLNKEGLLKSYKGKNGGFKLALTPRRIYLTDLMQAFQGRFRLNECIFKKRLCPNRNICALKKKIDGIENRVVSELKSITIGNLLEERTGKNGKKKNHKN